MYYTLIYFIVINYKTMHKVS